MAEDAAKRGDTDKAREYNQTAEAFANRLIATENQVNDLKTLSLQSAQAADQARAAVQQNSLALQQKLAERQKLMSQLDQAKMQEQLNRAMTSLNQTVDQDAPSFDQVRAKIEARYAKASDSELPGQTVEARMLEVQQATVNTEAQSRLSSCAASWAWRRPATPPPCRPRPSRRWPRPARPGSGASARCPRRRRRRRSCRPGDPRRLQLKTKCRERWDRSPSESRACGRRRARVDPLFPVAVHCPGGDEHRR